MRTGNRCTTLTKLPVAFWGGSRANVEPGPNLKPRIRPREYAPPAIHVGIHVDRLTDAQILQLCLFEIGVDPNFVKRANRHQALSGQNIVARIDIAACDNAVNFRDDLTIAKV